MADFLHTLERRARYLMGFVSLMLILALMLWKTGLVSTAPSYKNDAWYASSSRAGLVITTEYADEAACRSSNPASSITCRSGKSLAANEGATVVR